MTEPHDFLTRIIAKLDAAGVLSFVTSLPAEQYQVDQAAATEVLDRRSGSARSVGTGARFVICGIPMRTRAS